MAGLYIHIPFCSVKCRFCDFTAFSGQSRSIPRYLCALETEGNRYAPREIGVTGMAPKNEPYLLHSLSTLYVGGGTPSELGKDDLKRLLTLVSKMVPDTFFGESTFEANPESLTAEKIGILRDWGMTRVSLGLQAAQDRLLKGLGRQHDLKGFLEVYALARKAIPQVNVDLMFGLPGQTLADWGETLELVLGLGPDHVSLYGLRVEERTVFARQGVEADEDLGADMYQLAVDLLKADGFHHYEISNFARPGKESRHNLGYWSGEPYLGLGCGATSYINGERRTNIASLEGYCAALEAGEPPVASRERLEGKERLGEDVLLGLRRVDGMTLTVPMLDAFQRSFERLQAEGLLELRGLKARLTPRGLLVSNRAFQEFVAPFD